MGIPSYFSHIVRNHSRIIKRLNKIKSVNNFYLDIDTSLSFLNLEYSPNHVQVFFDNELINILEFSCMINNKFIGNIHLCLPKEDKLIRQ